jgi:predicted aspartyl protease
MAQETGVVNEQMEAVIQLRLLSGATIECQVDTGFSGTLLLPETFVTAHGLPIIGSEDIRTVSVNSERALVALAGVTWLEDEFEVRVIVGQTEFALIGSEMMIDCRLEIDYAASTVIIEKIQR